MNCKCVKNPSNQRICPKPPPTKAKLRQEEAALPPLLLLGEVERDRIRDKGGTDEYDPLTTLEANE